MDGVKRFLAELAKAICWVLMAICGIIALATIFLVIFEDVGWIWLAGWVAATAAFYAAGVWAFRLIYRVRDPEPDFLWENHGKYFERDGLAMVVEAGDWDERTFAVCFYLQNQYDQLCEVNVAARAEGALSSDLFDADAWEAVEVPAGAYVVVRAPMGVPEKYQGRRVWFRIGADVKYPLDGRRRIRPRIGKRLDNSALRGREFSFFSSRAVISRMKLKMPVGVREHVEETELPQILTIDQPDGEKAMLSNLGISG